jgi:F-type H+-transporting ATPase subunit gamma
MATEEQLKRRIESTEDLQSVVKTMKALAAVNIRQYEKAADSLAAYDRTVELGLQAVLRHRPGVAVTARTSESHRVTAVVFGSDQGMCGQLNEQVVGYAAETLADMGVASASHHFMAVGRRAGARLADEGWPVARQFAVPRSLEGVTWLVQDLLPAIEVRPPQPVHLFFSRHLSGASYRPVQKRLLPLDRPWLDRLRQEPWPSNALPLFTLQWDELFSALIRQYLFVSLFRATVESLASENASRLASMQGAERNIGERLEELRQDYHRRRQMAITEELLDIVSGFEALAQEEGDREK